MKMEVTIANTRVKPIVPSQLALLDFAAENYLKKFHNVNRKVKKGISFCLNCCGNRSNLIFDHLRSNHAMQAVLKSKGMVEN